MKSPFQASAPFSCVFVYFVVKKNVFVVFVVRFFFRIQNEEIQQIRQLGAAHATEVTRLEECLRGWQNERQNLLARLVDAA